MTNITKEDIKNRGLSITFVAKKLNIPRTTLDNYFRNICIMPDHIKNELNNLLN